MLRTLQLLMAAYRMFLSIFRDMSPENFQTAMKYLFGRTQKYLELGNILINLHGIRKKLFESPGGNRTLVLITLEKCFVLLNSAECVDILSQILQASSATYLQAHNVASFPQDLQKEAFRNLAENLWILGRYMVHLPLEEIRKINPYEMWLFVSYDNATKQLDMVYDITPDLAQAFLERIDASGFDMRNISTLLGLLVCFYHELLKSQLLNVAVRNQTLNDILSTLSDAVVGLATSQLESLSPTAVHSAISMLNQVSRWARSQTIILSGKYLLLKRCALSFHNVSQMGALAPGIDTLSFYNMNPNELSQAILTSSPLTSVLPDLPGAFFTEVSLFDLWKAGSFNASLVKNKELRPSQLLKGMTCWHIENLSPISFLNLFQRFENQLHLLSPFQINCLAWKFWTISEASVPPYLLAVLPAEFLESVTGSRCVPFLI
ncbi:hypothetical protein E2320_012158, partial [Naja naja]